MGDYVAKNDKLGFQEALPLRPRVPALPHGVVDGLGADAEDWRQGPAGVAEDLDPEVRDPVPGATDGGSAAALPKLFRANAHVAADAGDARVERGTPGGRAGRVLHATPEVLDEFTAPQDPLIAEVGLAAPAEGGHGGPPAQAAHQSPALEVGAATLGEAGRHEGAVGPAGAARGPGTLPQDRRRGLPGAGDDLQEGAVPAPGVAVQCDPGPDEAGAVGIQMDLPGEFEEVRVRFHDDRLIAVLEEVAHPAVPAIERPGVAGEQAPHGPGQGAGARPEGEVGVIGQEGPGVDGEHPLLRQRGQAGDAVRPVRIIPEAGRALDPPHHHVVERVRRIQAGLSRHGGGDSSITCSSWPGPPLRHHHRLPLLNIDPFSAD